MTATENGTPHASCCGSHAAHAPVGRRGLLTAAAALAGIAFAPAARAEDAQPAARPKTLIDVHRHFAVPALQQAISRAGGGGPGGGGKTHTVQALIDDMDKGGVAIGVLSTGTTAPFENPDVVVSNCRMLNDAMAKMRTDHPGRIGIFANLPLPNIDATLKEIEYAYDTLHVDGVHMFTNCDGKWLGDPSFAPVYEELARRKAVVKTHPAVPDCCQFPTFKEYGGTGVVELGTDTSRAIATMMLSGSAVKYHDIKWIFSHAGGSLTGMVYRYYGLYRKNPDKWSKVLPDGVDAELQRFYYDLAQAYHPITLAAIKELAGNSQLLFGTDYAFRTALETIQAIENSNVFNADELKAMGDGNARVLMPTLPA